MYIDHMTEDMKEKVLKHVDDMISYDKAVNFYESVKAAQMCLIEAEASTVDRLFHMEVIREFFLQMELLESYPGGIQDEPTLEERAKRVQKAVLS